MFYSLRGTLIHIEESLAVVECAGVGYKCFATANTIDSLPGVGEEVKLFTYLSVKEDSMEIFGFMQKEELDCFKLLISVSGVGSKVAIAILSSLGFDRVLLAIGSEDSKALTIAPGVGNKLAQRIVLELKDKVTSIAYNASGKENTAQFVPNNNTTKAVAALTSLGYTPSEALQAMSKIDTNLPVEELIRLSLKTLGGRF